MNKKLVCLALAAALLMSGVVYAIGPSKQTGDMTESQVVSTGGVEIKDDFVVDTKIETEFSNEVFEEVASFLEDGEQKIVDYFPEEVVEKIAELLPEGVDGQNLVVNEFMPLSIENYEGDYGDLTIAFKFPTVYEPGQAIIAMVGVKGESEIEWTALPAQANEDGEVEIAFTQETMELVAANEAVLAILSEAAE